MKTIIALFAATVLTAAATSDSKAQVGTTSARDDSAALAPIASEMTDSQNEAASERLADISSGPIAFGVISSSGQKQSGTANWSSVYNATYKRYEITITGQSYYYLNFSTLVTPTGDSRFCRTDSVGGKLLIYCYDHAGAVQPSRVAFTTFKAS